MLVLSRTARERIIINPGREDEIVITITEVVGKKVRLGIDAPDWMQIARAEIAERRSNDHVRDPDDA